VTIEFHCPHCSKLLKTPDDKAGVRANCPGCGELVTVPLPADEAAHADPSLGQSSGPDEAGPALAASGLPASSEIGAPDETRTCPMCGETIKKAATRCRFCGETLDSAPVGDGVPTRFEAGDALSRAWEIYKDKLGILVAAFLIFTAVQFAVQFGVSLISQLVQTGLLLAVGGGGAPGGNPGPVLAVIGLVGLVTMVVQYLGIAFLEAGYHIFLLKVARGQNADLMDLFAGSRYFWRVFLAYLLFTLMMGLGFLLLIVPGVIVALAFWPFMFLIVDRDLGVIESFRRSAEIASGNYGSSFLLWLVLVGLTLLGALALCVGLIFAVPLANLMFAVAYCLMSGQAVVVPRRP